MTPRSPSAVSPLTGIRVIDLTRHLPGPFAVSLLASLGAEVIKVELPQMPDPARAMPTAGALYSLLNRGKKSLCLDFAKPEGREALLKLLRGSRVFIEGFRPGLLERLGLGYPELKKKFPALIYCSITGYGQKGTRSRWSGHDLNYEAMSGVLSQSRELPPAPIADLTGSFYAAYSIAAALRLKKGAHLDVAMTETAASVLHFPLSELLSTGRAPSAGEAWWNGAHPFYAVYPTKDGRRVAVAALEKGYAFRLLDLMGRKDLDALAEEPLGNSQRLRAELAAEFAKKPLSDWAGLAEKEACLTPVYDAAEALAAGGPAEGLVAAAAPKGALGFPVRFGDKRPPAGGGAPALGKDGRRVLRRAGCTPAEIRALIKKRILAL